jgi:hypothetical protein
MRLAGARAQDVAGAQRVGHDVARPRMAWGHAMDGHRVMRGMRMKGDRDTLEAVADGIGGGGRCDERPQGCEGE